MLAKIDALKDFFEGDIYTDFTQRTIYATDASVYREMPLAVTRPKSNEDIKQLIKLAKNLKTALIPRTAGTSLAGQVVGSGIIVDVSKYFTQILEVNQEEKWVRVQPGVIRNDLNTFLKPYGLFFGPETSTASRCMMGGMVGNNSCGTHSPIYGTTRDHTLSLKTILSDGNEVEFKAISQQVFLDKCKLTTLEGDIYREFKTMLSNEANQNEIRKEFPDPVINRRNTGYAIDVLLESQVFTEGKEDFNFCKLLAGSEGTLAFTTEIKLNLVDLPPKERAILAIHSKSINHSLKANIIAMKHKPGASELMDKTIIDCTKSNPAQLANSFFIKGDPEGVLCVEFERDTKKEVQTLCDIVTKEVQEAGYGYHFPIIWGADTQKVWSLRADGLGLLANIPGDAKGVACIEDTAVKVEDLPDFIEEFDEIMFKHGKKSIYYAHAGDGEIHLRPILDLKKKKDRALFFTITDEVATLVKKYKGSMSGEHGDGRVRAPFIRKMIGDHNYKLIERVKQIWDPEDIFNPNKIVNAPPMNETLRYQEDVETPEHDTKLDFEETMGILRMTEKCNGTGVCRRTHISGGTMCPSYMATRNEKDSTRARANVLREFLTNSNKQNPFDHEEIKEVMDLCLSCKGCKSDCPSNVDMAALKSEFMYQYAKANGHSLADRMIGTVAKTNAIFSYVPWLFNLSTKTPGIKHLIKLVMNIAPERTLPPLANTTLRKWYKKHYKNLEKKATVLGTIHLFADEVVNYNDVHIGIATIQLLVKLGYEVIIPQHVESGRPAISKGLLDYAQKIANTNINLLKDIITEERPLVGIEPSSILTFRDEYPKLVNNDLKASANELKKHSYTIEEFIANEVDKGNISSDSFTTKPNKIKLHGHCHQKALSSTSFSQKILELPKNYTVETIPSGCCGMSGSFGYDKDHYKTSMDIGELVLFPAIRDAEPNTIIAAPGTSCRHQIKDGTDENALHPVEILLEAIVIPF